jgi:hypothetical protein
MKSEEELNRHFDEEVFAVATETAKNYIIKIELDESLGFVGQAMKFPTIFSFHFLINLSL